MATRTIRNRTAYRSATVLSGLALAAATTLLFAPHAAAKPTSITVHPGSSIGSTPYGTGCSYDVSAVVDAAGPVHFYTRLLPDGEWTEFNTINATGPGTVRVTWTPTETGEIVVNANQAGVGASAPPVTVGTGINTGSSCIVL